MSNYDDLRAELLITTPDGWRITPIPFSIPMPRVVRLMEDEMARSYRIKELELRTRIGTLEAEIEILRRPKRRKWNPLNRQDN